MDATQRTYNEIAMLYTANWKQVHVTSSFRKEFLRYAKNGRIIDMGCGPGMDAYYFSKQISVIGIDFSSKMIRTARRKFPDIKFIFGDMRKIRFKENSVDGVWASQSLHHIPKKSCKALLRKMKKYVKKNGIIFLSVREGSFEGFTDSSTHKIFSGRRRFLALYTEDEIQSLLKSIGYEIIRTVKKTRKSSSEVYINIFAKNIKDA